jgi:ABC-type sugar transport system permease subunit
MLIFVARIKEISQDIIDAAAVDGADFFQRTWFITLPLLREVTIVILMLEVINVFRMYDVIWTITEGGPNNVSHVLATYAYQNGFYYDKMGYGTAVSAIILILAGFFTFLQLKYLRGEEIT